jgi:hypothetical protein
VQRARWTFLEYTELEPRRRFGGLNADFEFTVSLKHSAVNHPILATAGSNLYRDGGVVV